MKIVKLQDINIREVVAVLKKGGLTILPTETLYGAMVDATNQSAVNKLTRYKNRPFGKPYSIAVTDTKMAQKYVTLNITAKKLYEKFLPGPLTVISKGLHQLANGVEAEDGTLGVRIPAYEFVLAVVRALGKPVTATSANASYKKRPYAITDILQNLSSKQKALVDLIVDAGQLPRNEPSTVVDTTLDDPVILRQGDIKLSKKQEVLSRSEEATKNVAKEIWQKYYQNQGKRAIVFALQGEMGAGKTIFTKGLALALGIKDVVTSPSYIFEQEYGKGKKKLHHIDAWRMLKSDELRTLGFENLIKSRSVVAIEWADRVLDVIREFDDEAVVIVVKIDYGRQANDRKIGWGTL